MEIDEWWYADRLPRDIAPQGLATERRFKALVFFCRLSYQSPEAGARWTSARSPEGEADLRTYFIRARPFRTETAALGALQATPAYRRPCRGYSPNRWWLLPICFIKNAMPRLAHSSRSARTHLGFMGRAPGPDLPPQMIQSGRAAPILVRTEGRLVADESYVASMSSG